MLDVSSLDRMALGGVPVLGSLVTRFSAGTWAGVCLRDLIEFGAMRPCNDAFVVVGSLVYRWVIIRLVLGGGGNFKFSAR